LETRDNITAQFLIATIIDILNTELSHCRYF